LGLTVPVKVRVVTFVRLSELLDPASELESKSGAEVGVDGLESNEKVMLSVPT
jgi:hypothetical protein